MLHLAIQKSATFTQRSDLQPPTLDPLIKATVNLHLMAHHTSSPNRTNTNHGISQLFHPCHISSWIRPSYPKTQPVAWHLMPNHTQHDQPERTHLYYGNFTTHKPERLPQR